jgi:hypothetical protein
LAVFGFVLVESEAVVGSTSDQQRVIRLVDEWIHHDCHTHSS